MRAWFGLYEATVPVLGLVLSGLLAAFLTSLAVVAPWADRIPVPVLLVLPGVTGALAGAALGNHAWLLTRIGSRRTAWWRTAWLVALTLITLAAWLPALTQVAAYDAAAVIRNLLGFLGLGVGTAALLRAGLAWMGPLPYAVVVMLGGIYRDEGGAVVARPWAWALADPRTPASWLVAVALLAVGASLFVARDGKP